MRPAPVGNGSFSVADAGFLAAASGDFSSLIFKSEKAKGGEVGVKSQWADRSFTLNATAFYYVRRLPPEQVAAVWKESITTGCGGREGPKPVRSLMEKS